MAAGVGRNYVGELGAEYFSWQQSVGEIGGVLNARKFADYIGPEDTLVDFGCGSGALLANVECAVKIGIEPNPHARKHAEKLGVRTVEKSDEIESALVDVVISNHALEHVLDPIGELVGLRRILKPGGLLVIYVPFDDFRSDPSLEDDINHHLYTWTPLLLRNLVAEAGFDVEMQRLVTHAWPPRTKALLRLPRPVFDFLARIWSVLSRRRQVMAVATAPSATD